MFDNVPPPLAPAAAPVAAPAWWRVRLRLALRLAVGLVLAALPMAASAVALVLFLGQAGERDRAEKMARYAETVALAIEGTMAAGLGSLETLAGSRALEVREFAAFRDEARRLLAREPAWHTITLMEGARQVMNLRHAADATPERGELPANRALPIGRPAAGELPDGRILLRVPVQSEGAVRGTLAAVLEAAALAAPIARIGLPPRWSAVLLDGEGRALAGGLALARPLLAPALAAPGRPQVLEDGGQALVRRIGETGWVVAVVAPPAAWSPAEALPIGLALLGAALSGAAGLGLVRAVRAGWRDAPRAGDAGAEGRRMAALPSAVQQLRPPLDDLLDSTQRLLGAGLPPPARALAEQQRRAAEAMAMQLAALTPPPPRLRLLLAEDVPASRLLLQSLLERAGHAVVAVEDGVQALAVVGDGAFDAAVLDLSMPRLDGLGAAQAIRRLAGCAGRLPLVALTAESGPEVEARCRAAGFDAVLAKPGEPRRLVGLIEAVRGRSAEARRAFAPG